MLVIKDLLEFLFSAAAQYGLTVLDFAAGIADEIPL